MSTEPHSACLDRSPTTQDDINEVTEEESEYEDECDVRDASLTESDRPRLI